MATEALVRPGGADDAAAVAATFGAAWAEMTYVPDLHTPEEDLAFFAGQLATRRSFVAERDGAVVGFAIYDDALLNHLYVRPGEQGRGIGSRLIEHVKERLPDGFDLWLFQQNAGARRFYERHGLACVEETDGSGNEERVPDARYRWPGS